MNQRKCRLISSLLCGLLGCILMACSDWLMIYADPAFRGSLTWLTEGAAHIPAWRNGLAMALAFPAVILCTLGLLGIRDFLPQEKHRRIYSLMSVLSVTPWLAVHLFYIMILYLFAWLNGNGFQSVAFGASEALVQQFLWLAPVSEGIMALPFFYLFYLFLTGRSSFFRWMAFNNPLIIYAVLKAVSAYLPVSAARLAFVNGLMSESLFCWFLLFLIVCLYKRKHK